MTSLYAWGAVACIVATSTAGDVLLSRGMKQVGDFGEVRRRSGVLTLIQRVLQNSNFLFGVLAMAIAFYSLLFGLSWGDVSLVVPASTSLTFVTNAIAARFFLHERVDQRRWVAALLVAGGVILLAF
ncbi:MAG TPA: EamA family transporter [Terriglobales bacterium]|jgi:drug/metabolite transporter (DMT)-like permease|nr:EamA family transporter [Terriglobales bacterium]